MVRYFVVESPDTVAEVDFISEGISLMITRTHDKLHVLMKKSHGKGSSSWDIHEVEFDCLSGTT